MDLVNKAMFNIDKKDLKSFDVMNGVLHTPYFARGKCIDEFDKKWADINKYFYAAIEYLKDSFLLVSYLKLEFRGYMKAKGDINGKLDKIADYLDELLSRDIEKFIRFYYMQDEKRKNEYKVQGSSISRFHYKHTKYFGMNNKEEYVKKYLFDNLYTHLNIFNYGMRETLDGYPHYNISKQENEIIEREEKFLEWE